MIPSVFSSPVPIASHQVKQAQAQGQSSNQGNSSSSQSQQSSSTSSKVVYPTTERTQTTSAEMNVPVNAETAPIPHSDGYGPMTAEEGSFMGVSSGSLRGQYGSGVGEVDHSNPVFHTFQQQQSFPPGNQQQQPSMAMGQQQIYLDTPDMQQGRHSQPPPTMSPYTEPRPHNDLLRSNSH